VVIQALAVEKVLVSVAKVFFKCKRVLSASRHNVVSVRTANVDDVCATSFVDNHISTRQHLRDGT
jgi:hypothetical protein